MKGIEMTHDELEEKYKDMQNARLDRLEDIITRFGIPADVMRNYNQSIEEEFYARDRYYFSILPFWTKVRFVFKKH